MLLILFIRCWGILNSDTTDSYSCDKTLFQFITKQSKWLMSINGFLQNWFLRSYDCGSLHATKKKTLKQKPKWQHIYSNVCDIVQRKRFNLKQNATIFCPFWNIYYLIFESFLKSYFMDSSDDSHSLKNNSDSPKRSWMGKFSDAPIPKWLLAWFLKYCWQYQKMAGHYPAMVRWTPVFWSPAILKFDFIKESPGELWKLLV